MVPPQQEVAPVAWADHEEMDVQITEIAAELEVLEADAFVTAWDFGLDEEPAPRQVPPGQSLGDPADPAAPRLAAAAPRHPTT
jgi:hypothetical protein